jgi:prepilin-type N-terminal cleavage/methylation domain-containing protein
MILPKQFDNRRSRGFTLVEVMVASGLASLVTGAGLLLLLESARESRRGFADATLESKVNEVQTRIIGCLRPMSADEGVIFADPLTDQEGALLGFRRIIVARGPAPDHPREELRFESAGGRAVHDPNRAVAGNEVTLGQSTAGAVVRRVSFWPSLKKDGTPDNSLINVSITADDNGSSGRPLPNAANVWRTFTVRMRNH